jgi:hypothetical protein
MEMMVWNIILSAVVALMGFFLRGRMDELERLGILLSKTREEIAREHITRAEMNAVVERLGDRFDRAIERLEAKLDTSHRG